MLQGDQRARVAQWSTIHNRPGHRPSPLLHGQVLACLGASILRPRTTSQSSMCMEGGFAELHFPRTACVCKIQEVTSGVQICWSSASAAVWATHKLIWSWGLEMMSPVDAMQYGYDNVLEWWMNGDVRQKLLSEIKQTHAANVIKRSWARHVANKMHRAF